MMKTPYCEDNFITTIRHMTAQVGLLNMRQIRLSIGEISFGDLKPGQRQEWSTEEVSRGLGRLPRGD